MDQKQKDLLFGLSEEVRIKSQLEEKYGKLVKLDKYNNYDYFNDDYFIEIKSRRIKHDKYKTLFFSKKKLDKAKKILESGFRIVFIWNCIDGLYSWEYTGSNDDEYFIAYGGRCDRGKDEYDELVNVKVRYITNIN